MAFEFAGAVSLNDSDQATQFRAAYAPVTAYAAGAMPPCSSPRPYPDVMEVLNNVSRDKS
jgi:hypothetical protein